MSRVGVGMVIEKLVHALEAKAGKRRRSTERIGRRSAGRGGQCATATAVFLATIATWFL